MLQSCIACHNVDLSEWALCDGEELVARRKKAAAPQHRGGRRRRSGARHADPWSQVSVQRLEDLTEQLFHLHDLNNDGFLEEAELIQLNEKIYLLHHGLDADLEGVRATYRELFRDKLDPDGRPVKYDVYRRYAREMLDGLDPDPESQELILEHFIEEARSGRTAFDIPALSSGADLAVASSPGSATTASPTASGREDTASSWSSAAVDMLPPSSPVVLPGATFGGCQKPAGEWRDARPVDVALLESGIPGQLGWGGL